MSERVWLVSGGWDSMAGWRLAGLPPARHAHLGTRAQEREEAVIQAWAARWGGTVHCQPVPGLEEGGNGWVPHRNAVLILLAAQHAPIVGLGRVAEWAPDKNGRFLRRLERLGTQGSRGVTQGVHGGLRVETPNAMLTKAGLRRRYAAAFGEDEARELWDGTWSCYTAGPEPCGTCSGCRQRDARWTAGGGRWRDGVRWLRDDGWRGAVMMWRRGREGTHV